MAKTLAELRAQASGPPPRPKAARTVTLIEGQHLLEQSRQLHDELFDVLAQAQRDAGPQPDEDERARTRKAGQAPDPEPELPARALEIKAEQAKLVDQLIEHQIEVGLEGISGGEWQRFKEDHPPRPDNQADIRLAGGHCDANALFGALGLFVKTYGGDEVRPGEWDAFLAEQICYADRRDLVTDIVSMYEGTIDRVPKSRPASPETQPSGTG